MTGNAALVERTAHTDTLTQAQTQETYDDRHEIGWKKENRMVVKRNCAQIKAKVRGRSEIGLIAGE